MEKWEDEACDCQLEAEVGRLPEPHLAAVPQHEGEVPPDQPNLSDRPAQRELLKGGRGFASGCELGRDRCAHLDGGWARQPQTW